jgi:N,N'-diacetyllegionaminate synthase
MQIQKINTKKKVLIIAEIGNNHEGSYALAEEMIGLAVEAGADAVKFQTIIPEKLVSIQQNKRIKQLKKFQLSYDEFTKLSKVAKNEGVIFLSTPFDIDSALFLNELVPAYKIASGDNDFYPLIEVIAEIGKPIIMSTGLMNLDELEKSVLFIKNIWQKNHNKEELALLHCVSSYPTPPENANLLAINELEQIADVVGYSDHTSGIEAAVLSIAFGARIIEKHFTIDNNYSDFHDHQLSSNPTEFKKMVAQIRIAEIMLGSDKKVPTDLELKSKQSFRRSIVANHNLSAGHKIILEDLDWVRPGGGVRPGNEEKLIGKILNRAMKGGEMIELKNLV